jgi:hypothetical protein
MLASTLFVRVVPQDKNRGYVLLAGYDAAVVQRTAIQSTTLSVPTRESLNKAIASLKASNSAAEVRDVTAPAIQKKLAKMFGEYPSNAPAAAPAGIQLFSSMPIGTYL